MMNETRDAPEHGGSGGLLEIIDMMCTVTETMAQVIREQAVMLERAKLEEGIREGLQKKRDGIGRQLDTIEIKMRKV